MLSDKTDALDDSLTDLANAVDNLRERYAALASAVSESGELEDEVDSLKSNLANLQNQLDDWSLDLTNDGTLVLRCADAECPQYLISRLVEVILDRVRRDMPDDDGFPEFME